MVLEDEIHRKGILSDKNGMRLREIVERKCPQEPGIHSNREFIASRMTPARSVPEWKPKEEK